MSVFICLSTFTAGANVDSSALNPQSFGNQTSRRNHRPSLFCLLNLHLADVSPFGISSAYTEVVCGLQGIEMTRVVLTKYWIVVSLLLCLLVAVTPIATADTVPLSSNNMGIFRSVDAATLTQAYLNKTQANVSMNRLYARKLQGGPFGFDVGLPRQLRPRHNRWRRHNLHGSSMDLFSQNLKTTQNVSQFGSFSFDLAKPEGRSEGGLPARIGSRP